MAMTLGIFAGTGMDARAEGKYEIVATEEPESYDAMKAMCNCDASDGKSLVREQLAKDFATRVYNSTHKTVMVIYETRTDDSGSVRVNCWKAGVLGDNKTVIEHDTATKYYKNKDYSWYILQAVRTESKDSDSTHTHSYSWVTVQDVSSEQDGIEEYRCSCGDVQERCVIPRYMAIVKGLFGEIKNAPQNGTATFDSGRLYTISDYVIKKLAERTDVTTVITFEYQNQAYKMTIPAGADFTGLLADEEYFYGYFFFANAVGATIEAIV